MATIKIFNGEVKHIWSAAAQQEPVFPPERLPEIAFVGRSNVGKSSLINAVLNRKKLARTSSTPGATRAAHFYEIGEAFNLVDLPGYGYAKISKQLSALIGQLMYSYMYERRNLKHLFILIDSRHGIKAADRDFLKAIEDEGVPVQLVFTKGDKAKAAEREKNLAKAQEEFATSALVLPEILQTSSSTGFGLDELRHTILKACELS